jgi:ribosomal protein L11 methylase PrmA
VANGVAERIEFYEGSITETTPVFDFVCANLTLDVIRPLLSLLAAKSKGYLLLSGILAEQKREILAELLKRNIIKFSIQHEGEWISVLITR